MVFVFAAGGADAVLDRLAAEALEVRPEYAPLLFLEMIFKVVGRQLAGGHVGFDLVDLFGVERDHFHSSWDSSGFGRALGNGGGAAALPGSARPSDAI